MENGYDNVLELMFHIQGIKLWSAADMENLTKRVDDLEKEVIDYVTRFNKKIIKPSHSTADVEVLVHDLRPESTLAETDAAMIVNVNSYADAGNISIEVIGSPAAVEKLKGIDFILPYYQSMEVVAAVGDPYLMLQVIHIEEKCIVGIEMEMISFMRPVCANYYERGKTYKNARFECCSQGYCVMIPYLGAVVRCVNASVPHHDVVTVEIGCSCVAVTCHAPYL